MFLFIFFLIVRSPAFAGLFFAYRDIGMSWFHGRKGTTAFMDAGMPKLYGRNRLR